MKIKDKTEKGGKKCQDLSSPAEVRVRVHSTLLYLYPFFLFHNQDHTNADLYLG